MHSPHTSFETFIDQRKSIGSRRSSSFPSIDLRLVSIDGVEGARAAFNSADETKAYDSIGVR
jgi:hypothetical protein